MKIPAQNLLRLLLLLMLMLRIVSTRFGQDFEMKFLQDFEAGVWLIFVHSCFEEVMKLNLGLGSEARFAADVWLKL